MLRTLAASLLVSGGLLCTSARALADDAAAVWMERLASTSASERQRAERWLATHLVTADYPELARAAQAGDAEVRRRLRSALAADDRHLGLACLLLAEGRAELAALGAAAFEELVLRWCPKADGAPAPRGDVVAALARQDAERFRIPAAVEPVSHALERLARLGDLSLPLVIAPELLDRPAQQRPELEGGSSRLLADLARLDLVTLAGVGDFTEEQPGRGAWVLISTLGAVHAGDGVGWLRTWCLRLQAARGPDAAAAAAARAIAASAWPAGLGWLEERWLERRDGNALSGLLLAAERGRVAPGLTRPGERRRILAYADQALAIPGAERRAERTARALAAAGAASPAGEDPALELIEGFDGLSERARWVRLVALEGTRSIDPRVVALLERVARAPAGASAGLRLQALRALAALPPQLVLFQGTRPGLVGLPGLFEHARRDGDTRELAGLLMALDAEPFELLLEAGFGREPAGSAAALFLLELACLTDRPEAVELLRRELARGRPAAPAAGAADSPLRELLATWVQRDGPGPAGALFARAAEGLDAGARQALKTFALLAGCLAPEGQVEFHGQLAERAPLEGEDYELLGALVAGPRGTSARARLLTELGRVGGRAGPWMVRGLDRAVEELRRAFLDAEFESFTRAVRRAASDPAHPLHAELRAPLWPPPVLPPARSLELSERRLPAGD